jgi:hypothetical protein
LKISIDKWALGYNKTWHPLLILNTLLTNWNSVAAPAPASAFLSAPAKRTESMIIRVVEIQVIYIKFTICCNALSATMAKQILASAQCFHIGASLLNVINRWLDYSRGAAERL